MRRFTRLSVAMLTVLILGNSAFALHYPTELGIWAMSPQEKLLLPTVQLILMSGRTLGLSVKTVKGLPSITCKENGDIKLYYYFYDVPPSSVKLHVMHRGPEGYYSAEEIPVHVKPIKNVNNLFELVPSKPLVCGFTLYYLPLPPHGYYAFRIE